MKYPTAHNTRGNPVSPVPALLLAIRTQEEVQDLYDGITYARFEYDNRLPRLLQQPAPVRAEPCTPDYWVPQYPAIVGRSHTHVSALRTPRTYGSEALKLAMQAKVRKLMADRADTRRAEWNALAQVGAA